MARLRSHCTRIPNYVRTTPSHEERQVIDHMFREHNMFTERTMFTENVHRETCSQNDFGGGFTYIDVPNQLGLEPRHLDVRVVDNLGNLMQYCSQLAVVRASNAAQRTQLTPLCRLLLSLPHGARTLRCT